MNNRFLVFLMLGLVFLSVSASALGITPGRRTFSYTPGSQQQIDFSVINTEGVDADIVILVQGELNASLAVSEVSFSLSASEADKQLTYTLTMPDGLEPGLHTAEVVALRLPSKKGVGEAFVGAAVGVATQVHVNVPYPGKYVDAGLQVLGDSQEGVTFAVPVVSRGELDIERVRGVVDIYSSLNEKVASLSTNELALPSQERQELVARWGAEGAFSGKYRAVVTVFYDEDSTSAEQEFTLGTKLLDLLQVDVNNFQLGGIAKIELLVENQWNEPIRGVFAQMQIFNKKGQVMADFASASYDVAALSKELLAAFWDTSGVEKGSYDASVLLRYGEHADQEDFVLEVSDRSVRAVGLGYVIAPEGEGGGESVTVLLLVVIGVLVLVNVLWFLVLRKRVRGPGVA